MTVEKPLWVRVGLWQINSRATALAFAVGAVFLASAGVAYGLMGHRMFLLFGLFYLSALWYWLGSGWMDSRQAW
ncbi:MAG: hypothetical protein A2138_25990 [Deltaproteobacteria bacterium RBG_16_71_12]|nr:MAG: hypothetical protein A2138_25990 [Deltaproteobacteria bacterium RBG_16_71_12]